jgi:hypothetical protein
MQRPGMMKQEFQQAIPIVPYADASDSSVTQRLTKAQSLYQMSLDPNGNIDRLEAEKHFIEALRIPNPDRFFKKPAPPEAEKPDPMLEMEMAKTKQELESKGKKAELDTVRAVQDMEHKQQRHQLNLAQKEQKINHDGINRAIELEAQIRDSDSRGDRAAGQ